MNKGHYLGAIRTVEDLMSRCEVDEVCGCWRYNGYHQHGLAKVYFRLGEKQIIARGRRAAMIIARGKELAAGVVAYARKCCRRADCVNPEHCRVGTRADRGRAQKGKPSSPRMRQANTNNGLKRAKLTAEKAREIRNSDKPLEELSQEYGVVTSCISAVRRGESWRHAVSGASVFSWRP